MPFSAVHAGWRGTLANVAAAAVEQLMSEKAASAEELHIAIGPAIRACCFEVGDEVVDAGRDADAISRPGPRARRHVDLIEDNRHQLLSAGIRPDRIYDSGLCTACANERFYSGSPVVSGDLICVGGHGLWTLPRLWKTPETPGERGV